MTITLEEFEELPDFDPERVGAVLLDDVHAFLGRFIAYPSEAARVAHTLWIAHTHLMDVWESSPRIAFLSPEPASGKTRCLEVSELLVPRAVEAVNVSPAYLFRKIASTDGRPTILFDEVDTVFGPKAKENEETRGLLNAGHRKGAVAGRCVVRGKTVETEELPAYCAVAIAGIGDLPDTILTRSVIVRMRRRAPDETVEPWRRRVNSYEAQQLGDRLAEWAASVELQVSGKWPEMPPEITDRNADVWEALLSMADAAGGEWPKLARVAAVTLVTSSKRDQPSLGIQLLSDVRQVFGDREAMATKTLLNELINMEESIWAEIKGKPMSDRQLAYRLRRYGIEPKPVRVNPNSSTQLRGYAREDFYQAWKCYLPSSLKGNVTSVTSETESGDRDPFEAFKSPSLRLVVGGGL
jgi:uncharacterized protein DUF3631